MNSNNRANGNSVRCIQDWYLPFFRLSFSLMDKYFEKQLLYDLFQAYYDARKNKRNTFNALAFEIDYERKLFKLYEEIKNGKYEIGQNICFMIFKPVQREIFAADFRDRIVHHLVYNYIGHLFERLFINDSYSCRIGKGTSYGIKRLDHFIRSCSDNYTKDCYILKLDIEAYFMSIDHNILYQKTEKTLQQFKKELCFDFNLILWLVRKIIFHDPVQGCVFKTKKRSWQGLPKNKSLFYSGKNKGLPIGNLTSQLFGNVYLNDFDRFIQYKLGCKHYGRYVDDLVIVHQNKEYLKSIIPLLKEYLEKNLVLKLHPKKVYLQHYSKGVSFLGTIIKPHRIYIKNQIKGNFYNKLQGYKKLFALRQNKLNKENIQKFLSSINSYLGIVKHYHTYKLRKKMLELHFLPYFANNFYIADNYAKIVSKN